MASSSSSSSGGPPPSYPLPIRRPLLTLRNPRSALRVADLAALLLPAAYDGDVPQVKTLVKRLRKAGKGVEEAMTELKASSWYKGHGPLHLAAVSGKVPMCKFLIKDLKLDVDAAAIDGVTPLIFAIFGTASTAVTRLLLDHHADPNKAASDGSTPLHTATIRDSYETAELLLSRRAYVDPVSECGTPLYIAAKNGNAKMLKLLLRHQADIRENVLAGQIHLGLDMFVFFFFICFPVPFISILDIECSLDRCGKRVAQGALLIKAGSHLNICTMERKIYYRALWFLPHLHAYMPNRVLCTPLKAAISERSLGGMELPIKAGADVNAGTITPLIAAAYAGSTDCIKCLLKADADGNIPDHNGRMPIEIAATQGWQECADVLFPVTTPLARVADWSTAGIIQHAKLTSSKPQDENDGSDFEAQGDYAVWESDYAHALTLYTMAVEIKPDDSTLYAKRSLCSLHMGDKGKALDDANIYKDMQPDLSKSCSAQAAVLILVKEYDRAVEALMTGLNLEFGRKPTDNAFSGDHP